MATKRIRPGTAAETKVSIFADVVWNSLADATFDLGFHLDTLVGLLARLHVEMCDELYALVRVVVTGIHMTSMYVRSVQLTAIYFCDVKIIKDQPILIDEHVLACRVHVHMLHVCLFHDCVHAFSLAEGLAERYPAQWILFSFFFPLVFFPPPSFQRDAVFCCDKPHCVIIVG